MARYIALLRGVNVGGITVKSAPLAELFGELGFEAVKTVLASGNVLFETDSGGTPAKDAALKTRIEKALGERFGYDAWIVLVEHDRLAGIVADYPFAEHVDRQPYVVFASDAEALKAVSAEAEGLDAAVERAASGAGVAYWDCPKGSSTDTAFSKFLAKPRFKAVTTTRNLRTLRKLL
ncbi:DUF1697 domain-containing protein [Herbiconiux moechotypicola]|uniref:DUF1697 domain-containing protein n=1 Tax=Herbiconiux moechotypicola TaxID=637393 RepID=A0ABP5QZL8_9MICO|nr:DUF1697 domain-containing protein [Herbiconiux moechotypicola]MCS5731638.1 DUF1697 domain-containing protein [Herbiconiux moechotypicola]